MKEKRYLKFKDEYYLILEEDENTIFLLDKNYAEDYFVDDRMIEIFTDKETNKKIVFTTLTKQEYK